MKKANLFFISLFISCQMFAGTFNIFEFGPKGDGVLTAVTGVSTGHFLCYKAF